LNKTPDKEIGESPRGGLMVTNVRCRCEQESGNIKVHCEKIRKEMEIVASVDRSPEERAVMVEGQQTGILFLAMLCSQGDKNTTMMTHRRKMRKGRGATRGRRRGIE
jgi:hypothetical protein